ncbi:MAG TPA: hypothetical protein VH592_16955 [Gemmataceae bacterium]
MDVVEAPELEVPEDELVPGVALLFILGGGSFSKLVLSLGGDGAGVDEDDDTRGDTRLLVVLFAVVLLLILLLELGAPRFVEGGGGMGRPGPFDGKCAVPSASAEA